MNLTDLENKRSELSAAVETHRTAILSGSEVDIVATKEILNQTGAEYARLAARVLKDNPELSKADVYSNPTAMSDDLRFHIENVFKVKAGVRTPYIVIEVMGRHEGQRGALNEIELYADDTLIPYTVVPGDDYIWDDNSGKPEYWDQINNFGYANLNDGITDMSADGTCLFNFPGPGDGRARFILEVPERSDINRIDFYTGDGTFRTIKDFKAFALRDIVDIDGSVLGDTANEFDGVLGATTTQPIGDGTQTASIVIQ